VAEKTGKLKMVSFRQQLYNDAMRKAIKAHKRTGGNKKIIMPMIHMGNPDHGIPYHGKDTYSGQFKKFKDRVILNYEKEGVHRVFIYQNNKYTLDEED
jgi:hypothetical protein